MAEVGSAFVSIVPSLRGAGRQIDSQLGPALDKSGRTGSKRLGSALTSGLKSAIAPGLAILGTAGVGSFLKGAVDEAREAQKVGARTNNVIRTTGGVAKVTAKEVGTLATAISNKTGIDDEAIQSGENLLLTFKNVRNETGKGAKIFDRATQAAVDLSTAGFGDLSGASKQLGKALNDPTKGITALGRAGVTFTDAQKKQIKGFVKANDLLSAQKIILKEVESQVGGAGAASATAGEKARVSFDNLKETIGTALLPSIDRFEKKLTADIIPAVSRFVTEMQDGTGTGGKVAKTLRDIYNSAKPVGTAIVTIVKAFAGLPSGAQKVLLLAGAALVLQSRFAGALPSLQGFSREATIAAAKTVAVRGGALAAGGGLGTLASKAGGATTSLGVLSTVGAGIATGFAVGGPWGAAIGGGASVLALFGQRSASAAAAQRQFDAAGKSVSVTLNEQTGALTKATRASAAKALADVGAFSAATKMGVSLKDVLNASLGSASALKRVDAATRAYMKANDDGFDSTLKAAKVSATLQSAVRGTTGAIADERNKIQQVNEAMGKAKDKTVTFRVDTPGLFGTLNALGQLGAKIDSAIAKSRRAKAEIGANANGTDNWRGGLTVVGEKGPELINLAKGAQVIPNHKLGDVAAGRSMPAGSLDSMSPQAIRAALDGMSLEVELTGGDRAKAKFVQAGLKAGARL